VGAASCGADPTAWIAGLEAEINELDGDNYYDVIGLAGALYGLAFVGQEFDPTAGEHAAATNLADMAAILAGYQINNGGFAWNSNYVIPEDGNETIQETAYAILALNEVIAPCTWAIYAVLLIICSVSSSELAAGKIIPVTVRTMN